ncbi:MAG: hypothetical protein JW873_03920 [Candidatus Saganbacteria bacterium]|nr:hypothetical protein [Candidatus Saganbacteria bacterium]
MKTFTLLFLGFVLLGLSACAPQPAAVAVDSYEPAVSAEVEAPPAASREALFVYSSNKNPPSRLVLSLTGEPRLLPSGYIRLVGVVSGPCLPAGRGKPTACLEIGGRGLALGEGESVDDYRIVRIAGDRLVLERTH